jgi:hypothetical protein
MLTNSVGEKPVNGHTDGKTDGKWRHDCSGRSERVKNLISKLTLRQKVWLDLSTLHIFRGQSKLIDAPPRMVIVAVPTRYRYCLPKTSGAHSRFQSLGFHR